MRFQTFAEMGHEIEKLNAAQRKSAKSIVATKLTNILVKPLGCKTIVECGNDKFLYRIAMGPRGKIWDVKIHDKMSGPKPSWD